MKAITTIIASIALAMSSAAIAGDVNPSKLKKKKQTPQGLYLTAKETHKVVSASSKRVLFVDVRTPSEVEFVGAPKSIDANIPYVLNDFTEWDAKKKRFKKVPNSNFTVLIKDALQAKGLNHADKIILMCRSGSRSARAANLLHQAGYENVYSVVEGFEGDKAKNGNNKGQRVLNGWKNSNLPWTYKHEEDKMYLEL